MCLGRAHRVVFLGEIRYSRNARPLSGIQLDTSEYSNPVLEYLTIIPRPPVGHELVDSQRGAQRRVGYNHLLSNKREWNNCFIKNAPKI